MVDIVNLGGSDLATPAKRFMLFFHKGRQEFSQLPYILGDQDVYTARDVSTALKALNNEGNRKDVMLILRSALRAFPQDVRLWHFAGTLAQSQGYNSIAQRLFEKGLIFAREDTHLRMSLSESSLAAGDIETARENINWMLNSGDNHFSILVIAAQIELEAFRNGDNGALKTAREFSKRRLDIGDEHPVSLSIAAQIELEAFRNGDNGALKTAREFSKRRLDIGDDHPASLTIAAQIELEAFRNGDNGALKTAREFSKRRLDIGDEHPVSLSIAAQIELEAFRNGDNGALKTAREFSKRRLDIGDDHPASLTIAAQIELEAFRNGDNGALKTARELSKRRLDIDDDHPVSLVIAAQIELEADSPQTALRYIERMPESARRKNDVVTYIEAKAHMRSGFEGVAKQLITPIIQRRPDEAFTTLYLSCFEAEETVGMFKTILGQGFATMWENSRDIRTKIHATPAAERKLFYGSSIWELGAQPINNVALGQMAALPKRIRRSLAEKSAARFD